MARNLPLPSAWDRVVLDAIRELTDEVRACRADQCQLIADVRRLLTVADRDRRRPSRAGLLH